MQPGRERRRVPTRSRRPRAVRSTRAAPLRECPTPRWSPPVCRTPSLPSARSECRRGRRLRARGRAGRRRGPGGTRRTGAPGSAGRRATPGRQIAGRDKAADIVAWSPSLPMMTTSNDMLCAQRGRGLDQDVESLLRTSRPTPRIRKRSRACRRPARPCEQRAEVGVQPVIEAVDLGARRHVAQHPPVGPRAGDGEASRLELAAQHAFGIRRVGVDVLGVAGERERQPGDLRREPGDCRGAVRVVRVQVPHGRACRAGDRRVRRRAGTRG